jgi:hypothetical protein
MIAKRLRDVRIMVKTRNGDMSRADCKDSRACLHLCHWGLGCDSFRESAGHHNLGRYNVAPCTEAGISNDQEEEKIKGTNNGSASGPARPV